MTSFQPSLPLPGLEEGRRLRDEGLEAFNGDVWVEKAREIAYQMCLDQGSTDAYRIQLVHPRPSFVHPNAVGAIFKDKRFKPGGWRYNPNAPAHGRAIRVWKLR